MFLMIELLILWFLSKLLVRAATAYEWFTEDPILEDREIAYERDTGKYKIGEYRYYYIDG